MVHDSKSEGRMTGHKSKLQLGLHVIRKLTLCSKMASSSTSSYPPLHDSASSTEDIQAFGWDSFLVEIILDSVPAVDLKRLED